METKVALLLILFYPILMFGQKWDYPIKPGTEKWKNLTTGQAMIDACQIPEDILQKMNKFANITENTAKFLNSNIAVNNNIIEEIVKTHNNANL